MNRGPLLFDEIQKLVFEREPVFSGDSKNIGVVNGVRGMSLFNGSAAPMQVIENVVGRTAGDVKIRSRMNKTGFSAHDQLHLRQILQDVFGGFSADPQPGRSRSIILFKLNLIKTDTGYQWAEAVCVDIFAHQIIAATVKNGDQCCVFI